MIYRIGRFIFKIISFFFFPATIKGLENLPKEGSFILASNHLSNLDPFAIGTFCGRVLSFMAKDSLFKNKLLGAWISSLGAFPIKRNSADFRALREALRRLKKGPILIFPEGTRFAKDGRKDPQPGIGFLAAKGRVPIYPAYIEDSDKVLPPRAKFLKRHPITITFGKSITYLDSDSYDVIAEKIIHSIYALPGSPQSDAD